MGRMTPRELCRRAIEFNGPERLPMSYPSCGHLDLVLIPYTAPKGWEPAKEGEDEWGAVWLKTNVPNMGQMVGHPLADWAALDTYTFPDPDDPSRFAFIESRLPEFSDHYIVVLAETVLTLWERFYSLRGFDQALLDPYLYPDQTRDLLDRILDFHVRIVRNLAEHFEGRIDGFLVSDDWGTQTNTLFPADLWRTFFKERYRTLVETLHDDRMHAILHSDGRINDYLPDLVEVGFDAFNLHSPTVVGIEEIGREFAGKVAFIPCIDIQNTFARGTPDDVRREARLLLEHWGTRDGGIIPTEYGREAVGAPHENVVAAFEAFRDLGMMAHCGYQRSD